MIQTEFKRLNRFRPSERPLRSYCSILAFLMKKTGWCQQISWIIKKNAVIKCHLSKFETNVTVKLSTERSLDLLKHKPNWLRHVARCLQIFNFIYRGIIYVWSIPLYVHRDAIRLSSIEAWYSVSAMMILRIIMHHFLNCFCKIWRFLWKFWSRIKMSASRPALHMRKFL